MKETWKAIKIANTFEEIKTKIRTQLKLLKLREKECMRILKGNKKCEIEKHLQHVEPKFELMQELKYAGREIMVNSTKETQEFEYWSSVSD